MFILNNNDVTPLYRQLYTQIREHVLSGKLPSDSRLPSVRDLADELSAGGNGPRHAVISLKKSEAPRMMIARYMTGEKRL